MKRFYSFPDIGVLRQVPQSIQHLAIHRTAHQAGGNILFYYMEDLRLTLRSQALLISRLPAMAHANGIVFFSLHQFRYDGRINLQLMRRILALSLEIHFSCEEISICNVDQLSELSDFLLLVDQSLRFDTTGLVTQSRMQDRVNLSE